MEIFNPASLRYAPETVTADVMCILGAATSIAEMFPLGKAESIFSIGIENYDWEIFRPLVEEVTYQVSGGIVEAERLE